jgi:hypothetical protein
MNVISFFSSFLPGKIAGDVSFFLLFIGGSLALAFVLGRTRIISVVVFSYVAFAFVETIPATMFSFAPEGKAMIFLGLLVFLVAIGDYILDIHISNPTSTFFSRILVMGCLGSGLVLSLLLSLVSEPLALRFLSPTVHSYFTDPFAQLAWMAAPLFFLLFINKRKH